MPHFVAANHDTVAVIDEIDNGIHDYLLKELIESIAPCIHGQLIFTTHNMLFSENYDFKDNIYVIDADTDGNKTVKALCEITRFGYKKAVMYCLIISKANSEACHE